MEEDWNGAQVGHRKQKVRSSPLCVLRVEGREREEGGGEEVRAREGNGCTV